jgi:hypothetical protein
MAEDHGKPRFIDAWLTDLRDDYRRYGWTKLVPIWVFISLAVGALATWKITARSFWDHPEISIAFLGVIATINGLLLALSWGSFAKIYEIASVPKFAAYLRRHGLLNTYSFFVDYIHATQVLAVLCAFATLTACVLSDIPIDVRRILLGFTVASSVYAFKYALGAVRIMQDLVWYAAVFETEGEKHPMQVHEGRRQNGEPAG